MATEKKGSAKQVRTRFGDCQTCDASGKIQYRKKETCHVCNGTRKIHGLFFDRECGNCGPDGKVTVSADRKCVTCKGEGKIKFLILRGACPSCCGRKTQKGKRRPKKCRVCRGKKTVRVFYPVKKCASCDDKRRSQKRRRMGDCSSCRGLGMINCDGSPIMAAALVSIMGGDPLSAAAMTLITGSTFAGVAVGVLSAGTSQESFLNDGVVDKTDLADFGMSESSLEAGAQVSDTSSVSGE